MQRRAHRLAAGGLLGQAGDVHLAPLGQQQGAGDGRGGHHQHVGQLALAAEQQALVDAEAVLLVDHRQRQVVILDGVLEQRVGADDHADGAVLQGAQEVGAGAALHAAGQDRHRLGRQARQGAMVLLGQHLGGGHQGGLLAGLHRAQHRQQGDHGLAGADIALQQAEHAAVGGQVGVDFLQGLGLGVGQGVAEAGQRLGAQVAVAEQAVAGAGAQAASDDGQGDLVGQQFVVGQAGAVGFGGGLGRCLDCAQGIGEWGPFLSA